MAKRLSLSLPPAAGGLPGRGRLGVIATPALLAALAWAAVILWARSSAMMDAMPGRATAVGVLLFAGMWLVMMAAMMLPSLIPSLLLFHAARRRRGVGGIPMVHTALFVGGYLGVWTLAGIAADLAYLAVEASGARLHANAGAVPVIGGAIVVLAGLYQFARLKHVCQSHGRLPIQMIPHSRREGHIGAMRMGGAHGAYCLGCCWGIMAVLFIMGLMNLAWMAALSILIVAEKLAPRGVAIGRLGGIMFIALGVGIAVQPQRFPPSGLQPSDAAFMSSMTSAAPPSGIGRYTTVAGRYAVTLRVRPRALISGI